MKSKAKIQSTKDTSERNTPYTLNRQNKSDKNDTDVKITNAYIATYDQACLLLKAIRINNRKKLSEKTIDHLAASVVQSWEVNPDKEKIDVLAKLMSNLLDSTAISPDKPLDEALKEFCSSNVPTHSISPDVTLLLSVGYIERLKKRYSNIKGTHGCSHRLIMVAYMMAAKFLHVNLKTIIDTAIPVSPSQLFSRTPSSAERSTLSISTTIPHPRTLPPIIPKSYLMPSPPTSPVSYTNSDPLKYHYFQSPHEINLNHHKSPLPVLPSREQHLHILRMEIEFLHFLNYDLKVSNIAHLIY